MRSILAGCVGLFLRSEGKKTKVSLRKCLKVVGVKFWRAINAQCVTRVGIELRNRGRVGCLYRYLRV